MESPPQQPPPAPTHQRILTPKALQQRCLLPGDGSQAAMTAITRAERALDQLSENFDDWMRIEVDKLLEARHTFHETGFSAQGLDAIFAVAHDLKGHATTFGYPFAADICASLCRLIEACSGSSRVPSPLIDQHVDAVAAIVREEAKGPDHPKASVLARKLYDVTQDYLVQISRRRNAQG
jgi:chemotaxis protein histidine kinase CheA